MRMSVAEIIVENLKALGLDYPTVSEEQRQSFAEMRRLLTEQD
jgi:hypothetical protein